MYPILQMQFKVVDRLLRSRIVQFSRAVHASNPWQEICLVVRRQWCVRSYCVNLDWLRGNGASLRIFVMLIHDGIPHG